MDLENKNTKKPEGAHLPDDLKKPEVAHVPDDLTQLCTCTQTLQPFPLVFCLNKKGVRIFSCRLCK